MLMSIAIAPSVLQPSAIHERGRMLAVLHVLRAIAENGVIVAPSVNTIRTSLLQLAAEAKGAASQRLQLVATEISKRAEHFVVAPPTISRMASDSGTALCSDCAAWGDVDAIIYLDEQERASLVAHGAQADLLVAVEDFSGCIVDELRTYWRTTQRLDNVPAEEASKLVSRVIRYSKSVAVADKMIGAAAKAELGKLKKHLQGIMYLAKTWNNWSPYAKTDKLEIKIVTIAGDSGARMGYLDPDEIRHNIVSATKNLDRSELIGKLQIELKQDGDPQIFNDRLLVSHGRVWGVHHGLDDLGKLGSQANKRPTMVDPHSDARHTVFRDILSLRSADRMSSEARDVVSKIS
jgi:hypothetical protein